MDDYQPLYWDLNKIKDRISMAETAIAWIKKTKCIKEEDKPEMIDLWKKVIEEAKADD